MSTEQKGLEVKSFGKTLEAYAGTRSFQTAVLRGRALNFRIKTPHLSQ